MLAVPQRCSSKCSYPAAVDTATRTMFNRYRSNPVSSMPAVRITPGKSLRLLVSYRPLAQRTGSPREIILEV